MQNDWYKSSFSSGGDNCVEVRKDFGMVEVRHSKDGVHILSFTTSEWDAFIRGVQNGEFGS